MTERESPSQRLVALALDGLFLHLLLSWLVALLASLAQRDLRPSFLLALPAFSFLVALLYHSLVARTGDWLSPGEVATGAMVGYRRKLWRNPYRSHRIGLYLMLFVSLGLLPSPWLELLFGLRLPYPQLLVRGFVLLLMITAKVWTKFLSELLENLFR